VIATGTSRGARISYRRAPHSNDTTSVAVDTEEMRRQYEASDAGPTHATLWLMPCPDPSCDAVAEICDRVTLGSTHGPIEHLKTRCLAGHLFVLPADRAHRSPAPTPSAVAATIRKRD
jgi:hypothetical protein